ncbi:MAG: sugar phosphate isomerase/epimerase family protein [Acidobacteriota bacterium]
MSDARFSVSTFLFHQSRLDREHLVHIAAHGFGGVELFALRSHFDYTDARAVAQVAEWLDDTRLQLTAVHAPTALSWADGAWTGTLSIASSQADSRVAAVAEMEQTLRLARVLPFATLVLHVGVPEAFARPGDNDAAAARRSLETIIATAAGCGVQVALEVQTNALSTPDALVAFIEELADGPATGICLDVGHARLLGDPVDAIETAAGHIVAAHVHDTRGSRDDHLVPYDGSIAWAPALLAFQKVGYAGPWTFELAPAASLVATLARAAEARQRFEHSLGINDELMSS